MYSYKWSWLTVVELSIEVEKLYFPSGSQCNDAVACLTDVESPSDFSAGVHDLSELCCGLYFESDSIVLSNYWSSAHLITQRHSALIKRKTFVSKVVLMLWNENNKITLSSF